MEEEEEGKEEEDERKKDRTRSLHESVKPQCKVWA